MRIKLARTAGFCMGVKRATNIVLNIANTRRGRIFTLGPLIHNPQVIDVLRAKGVEVLERPEDAPLDRDTTVIIRSHGVSPGTMETLRSGEATVCDATCPRVARVQQVIQRHAEKRYAILIVGDRGHAEVTALSGYAGDSGFIVEGPEDVNRLPDIKKACLVAQTTQSQERFEEVVGAARRRIPNLKVFNTICRSTSRRQKEVIDLCQTVDALIVVGGKNSANTTRLAQISRDCGVPTFHVETEEELRLEELSGFGIIGITAGASTPNWMIQRITDRIRELSSERRGLFLRALSRLITVLVRSNVYVAFGAAAISYASCKLQGIPPQNSFLFIAASYIFSMHILNHFTEWTAVSFNDPTRILFYVRYRKYLIALGLASALTSIVLSLTLGLFPFLFLLFMSVLGIVYRIRLIPRIGARTIPYRRLMDIPASKDVFLALAWAFVLVVIHVLSVGASFTPSTWTALCFVFLMAFTRSVLGSYTDIQGDLIVGRETLPILLGKKRTKIVLFTSTALMALVLFLSAFLRWTSTLSYFLILCPLYTAGYLYLYHRRMLTRGVILDFVVESKFLLAGIIAVIYRFLA
jgi:4-hydroxy-3-methylbut-2-enyl diphosphate reductase